MFLYVFALALALWCRARRDGGLAITVDLRSNDREAVWTWRRLLLRTIDDGGI